MNTRGELIRGLHLSYAAGATETLPCHYDSKVLPAYTVRASGAGFAAGGAERVDADLGTVAHYVAYRTSQWIWRTPAGGYGWSKTRREAARQLVVEFNRRRAAELQAVAS